MKHNPRAQREGRGAARPRPPAPGPGPEARPGRARADVAAGALAERDLRPARTSRLQPSAGSHGELAGLLLTRAYHDDRGEHRHKVLTPDTAHGTNPATVTMAGYEVVKVATDERGGVDLDDLREKATEDVACLMLTNPNTLGLFDENIAEIASIVHGIGGTLYYDGANLNAIMGDHAAGRHGLRHRPPQPAQVVQPAARRRRARRRPDRRLRPDRAVPAGAADRAQRGLERRRAALRARARRAEVDRPPAGLPGQLRGLRPLLRLHLEPRRRRPARGLGDRGPERQLPAREARRPAAPASTCRSPSDRCMHEFVLSGAPAKRELGVRRSTSPSGCSTTASTRRRSTSRCSSTRR